jgi:hypothetical protein
MERLLLTMMVKSKIICVLSFFSVLMFVFVEKVKQVVIIQKDPTNAGEWWNWFWKVGQKQQDASSLHKQPNNNDNNVQIPKQQSK